MNSLVFYTSTDRKGQHDATGAFEPEAQAFARIHGATDLIPVPQNRPVWDRRWFVRRKLRQLSQAGVSYDAVVYFGHGTPSSLPGLGLRQGDLKWFVDGLVDLLRPDGVLVLYACLAGRGFGIGDRIDVALADRGYESIRTVAHLTPGHVSINPHTEYSGEGPTDRGLPVIPTSSPLWPLWVKRLREDQAFRLSFPFMSEMEIAECLAEVPATAFKGRCPQCGYEVKG